ncbi:hypothetical protein DD237_000937 [Peronospora effusa]|uniref:RxLR effector protein n=1 Tax=Peronospora effusa TaxID=542832 RepID=A0A3R7W8J0_9STRA|nr:hypothetical protein DD237_000937 [Peronospora effusa]
MRHQLVKFCAVVAVHLVAVGAHDGSPNVITKSARALQLGQGTKNLRTHRSTQDDKQERGNNVIATEVSSLKEKIKSAPSPGEGDSTNILKRIDEDNGKKVSEKDLDAHVDKLRKVLHGSPARAESSEPTLAGPSQPTLAGPSQPTLAGPSQPTLAEPTLAESSEPTLAGPSQPTLAEPSLPTLAEPSHSTLTEPSHFTLTEPAQLALPDKSSAEAIKKIAEKTKLSEKEDADWLQQGKRPITVLTLLNLDKARDDFLERTKALRWIVYLNNFNNKHPKNPTTVIAALKEVGFNEETLLAMILSWDMRQKNVIKRVKNLQQVFPVSTRKQIEEALLLDQEDARTQIIQELKEFWLSSDYLPAHVRNLLGLSPDLQLTGYDFSRVAVLADYVRFWNKKRYMKVNLLPTLRSVYTMDQIKELAEKAGDKHSELANALKRDLDYTKKTTFRVPLESSRQKRKRDT